MQASGTKIKTISPNGGLLRVARRWPPPAQLTLSDDTRTYDLSGQAGPLMEI
jgi:hypothetical protein